MKEREAEEFAKKYRQLQKDNKYLLNEFEKYRDDYHELLSRYEKSFAWNLIFGCVAFALIVIPIIIETVRVFVK